MRRVVKRRDMAGGKGKGEQRIGVVVAGGGGGREGRRVGTWGGGVGKG